MRIFLPYPSLAHSVACLDDALLMRQRTAAIQILATLRAPSGLPKEWQDHPSVAVWRRWQSFLAVHATMLMQEMDRRDMDERSMRPYGAQWLRQPGHPGVLMADARQAPVPPWIGNDWMHSSHRSCLLRRDLGHYGTLGWTEDAGQEYVYPMEIPA